jgi:hypothetical protein
MFIKSASILFFSQSGQPEAKEARTIKKALIRLELGETGFPKNLGKILRIRQGIQSNIIEM